MADPQSSTGGQSDLPAAVAGEELRASHADRDQVVKLLRVAAGDGLLSRGRTGRPPGTRADRQDLRRARGATADLPATPGAAVVPPGAVVASAMPKDLIRIHVHGSSASRDGRWVVPKELDVKVRGGAVTLDFTEAAITQPLLRITAEVRGGGLRLITRPGIVVDADDRSFGTAGASRCPSRLAPASPSSCASRSQARFTAQASPPGRPLRPARRDARSGNGCAAPRVPPPSPPRTMPGAR